VSAEALERAGLTTFTFAAEAHNVRAARHEVEADLRMAGVESSGLAVLLTSELVSNAVEHAGTDFDVIVQVDDHVVRIEIHDGAAVGEALRDLIASPPVNVDPTAPRGRGLFMVGSSAVRFGLIDKGESGKAVWFELRREDA
jgi:anti-sigma regulatory factor (Ser/Thr protein kinase)